LLAVAAGIVQIAFALIGPDSAAPVANGV